MELPTSKTKLTILFLGALALPSIAATLARWWFPTADSEGHTASWFETAGQFGDHFGFLTCVAALFAAYFTSKTLESQRELVSKQDAQSEKHDATVERTQRENRFFRLYDEFREVLKSNQKDVRHEEGHSIDTMEYAFEQMQPTAKAIMEDRPYQDLEFEVDRLRYFCFHMSAVGFLGKAGVSEVAAKFYLCLKFLDLNTSQALSEADDFYRETLITTLTEKEAKVLCLLLIEQNTRHNDNQANALNFTMAARAMKLYMKIHYNMKLSDIECLIGMTADGAISNRISMIRGIRAMDIAGQVRRI